MKVSVLLFVAILFAATDSSYAGELDLKNAPGVYQLMHKSISLADPDARVMHLHHRLRILDREAMGRLGDIKIPYNAHYQSARLIRAETITPDGHRIPVQEEIVRDMLPENTKGYSEYSDTRLLAFSMPGLVRDAVIDYEVEIRFKPVMPDLFAWTHFFDHALPVQTSRFVVTVPVELDLVLGPQALDTSAVVVTNGPLVKRSWELRDIPGIKPEANLPPIADIRKTLRASSLDSWDAVVAWYAGLMEGRISESGEVKALAEGLTAGLDDPLEQINALLYYVQKDIRYVAIELGQGAYQPRPADACLRNLYGDCKDQSVVLISLLRAAGFPANIALVRLNFLGKVYKHLPEPGQFNHAIVYLKHAGEDLWLDPTGPYIDAESWHEGLDGVEALVIDGQQGSFKSIPALREAKCLNERTYRIEMSPDSLHRVVFSERAHGRRAGQLRRVLDEIGSDRMEEEMRRNAAARPGFQRMLGYRVDPLEHLSPSFSYEISYISNQVLMTGRDSYRTTLEAAPTAAMLLLKDWSRGREDREQDWVNLATRAESLKLEIKLAPGYKLSNAVRAYEKKLAHGTLTLSADLEGGRLIAGVKAVLKRSRVRPSRFDALRLEAERLIQRADQALEFVDEPAQLLMNRQPHEARAYLGELIAMYPRDAFLHLRLGNNLVACGYRQAAEKSYARAVEIDPSVFAFYERWANMANIYDAALGGHYHRDRVIETLEKSRDHLAENKFLDLSLSIAHATDRHRMLFAPGADARQALAIADGLVKQYPDDPLVLNWRGVSHYHLGEYAEATDLLSKALKKGSRLVETQQALWRSEILGGEMETGLNRLATVVKRPNQMMSEMIFLMQKLAGIGNLEDATFLAHRLATRARRPEIEKDLMAELRPLKGRVIPDFRTMLDQRNPAAAARSFISAYHYGDRVRIAALIPPVCDLACSEIVGLGNARGARGVNPELRDLNLAMLFNEFNATSQEFSEDLVRYQVRREASSIRSAPEIMSLLLMKREGLWWVIDFDDPGGRGPNLLAGVLEEAWQSNNRARTRALVDYIRARYSQSRSRMRGLEYRSLNQPLASEPEQALALLAGALIYSGKQDKVQRGTSYLEGLVERHPEAAILHDALGRAYTGETRPGKAAEHKARVLKLLGTRENLLADLVQGELRAGQVSKALRALEELEIEFPASRYRAALRKEYHLRANELEEALRRTIDPGDEKEPPKMSMLDLFVYLDTGATNHFDRMGRAMRIGPPDLNTYEQLGMGYLALGDLDRAREQFEIMQLVQPGNTGAQLEGARLLLIQGKESEAQRILDDYVGSTDCAEEWRARICYVLHGQGNFNEAIAAYAVASKQRPAMAGEYFRLLTAVCYMESGDRERASEWLTKVANWEAQESPMTIAYAEMLMGVQLPEDVEDKVRQVEDYVLRKDHLTEFYYYRGMMDLLAGDRKAALAGFRRCTAELRPHNMEYFLARMQLVNLGKD